MSAGPLVAAAAAIVAYLLVARRVGASAVRRFAFATGAALAGVALAVDPGTLARHMAQHVAVTSVAAPLVVLGAPHVLALRATSAGARRPVAALLHGRLGGRGPAWTAWLLFLTATWLLHLDPAIDLAERSEPAHVAEHLLLLGTALGFWLPALAAPPAPARLTDSGRFLYLLAAVPAMDALALVYLASGRTSAGVVMLVGSLPIGLAAVLAAWRWIVREERRALRREALRGA